MCPRSVLTDTNSFTPFLSYHVTQSNIMLMRKPLKANVSICLMEANGLFNMLSIHPSIFYRLSVTGSRGQLSEQGHPDFPHHVVWPSNMAWFSYSTVFTHADQLGSREMISICQIPCMCPYVLIIWITAVQHSSAKVWLVYCPSVTVVLLKESSYFILIYTECERDLTCIVEMLMYDKSKFGCVVHKMIKNYLILVPVVQASALSHITTY